MVHFTVVVILLLIDVYSLLDLCWKLVYQCIKSSLFFSVFSYHFLVLIGSLLSFSSFTCLFLTRKLYILPSDSLFCIVFSFSIVQFFYACLLIFSSFYMFYTRIGFPRAVCRLHCSFCQLNFSSYKFSVLFLHLYCAVSFLCLSADFLIVLYVLHSYGFP